MITFVNGDIFQSDCQTLAVPVNTVGVMGKGLALAFAQRFPDLKSAYQRACKAALFEKEGLYLYAPPAQERKILCVPTKQHWRYPSKLRWIDEALYAIVNSYRKHEIYSLALPALGCGEGGLAWDDVKGLMEAHLAPLPIPIEIYVPYQ